MPIIALRQFYVRHELYVQLVRQYPRAKVVKDALPLHVIKPHQHPLEGISLVDTGFAMLRQRSTYAVAQSVASSSGYIAQPLACAEACYMTGYAMLKSAHLYTVMLVGEHRMIDDLQNDHPVKSPKSFC